MTDTQETSLLDLFSISKPRYALLFAFLLLVPLFVVRAQDSDRGFTLYLVRHAEKELSADNPKDPTLTPCGEERAESLAHFLSSVDLEAVYSTDYLRTRNTAHPVAREKEIEVQIYDPKNPDDFAKLLVDRKQNALVVGHSNSTPTLAGLLLGEELESIDESIYDRIYQLVFFEGKARLQLFHSTFECSFQDD